MADGGLYQCMGMPANSIIAVVSSPSPLYARPLTPALSPEYGGEGVSCQTRPSREQWPRELFMIEVIDYHKNYYQTPAVAGLSFSVQPGEILGLLGPNGAGKTTTMRAITGIIPPTRGSLRVAGHDVVTDPVAAKSALAYVPDDPRLFDALTVWEHLEFVAAAYRLTDWKDPAARLLERFELTPKRDAVAHDLSRGMRQKAALCMAYLHQPKAILLDEPMTGLDPRGIRTLKESVVERARDGASVLISSHLLALVEDLCTHLLILHHGKSLFFGRVAEARTAFASVGKDASLEDVFFSATETRPVPGATKNANANAATNSTNEHE